jgi:integrase/recombinase XerD
MKTIERTIEDYLADCTTRGAAKSWTYNVRFFLRAMARNFSEQGINHPADITCSVVSTWQQSLASATARAPRFPLRPISIWTYHSAARRFLGWLNRQGLLAGVVLQQFAVMNQPATRIRPVLTHAKMRRFLAALPAKTPREVTLRALAEFLYSTGARIGEALAMDVGDMDFENEQAHLLGKGRKERMVPVGRTACAQTRAYVQGIRPLLLRDPRESALWLNLSGQRFSYRAFKPAWAKTASRVPTEIKVTAHLFRRSCASELARGGADLWSLREILGHDDFESLKYYVDCGLPALKKAHARFHPRDNGMDDNFTFPVQP